jgi:hypothetical protein
MLAGLVALPGISSAQTAPDDASLETRRAKIIARALEAGRVEEALIEAEGGAKRFPESSLLRRRLAQASLSRALELDADRVAAVRRRRPLRGGDPEWTRASP